MDPTTPMPDQNVGPGPTERVPDQADGGQEVDGAGLQVETQIVLGIGNEFNYSEISGILIPFYKTSQTIHQINHRLCQRYSLRC